MFKRIKKKIVQSIVNEIEKSSGIEQLSIVSGIKEEERIITEIRKARARLTKLRSQIERLESKKKKAEDMSNISGAWLLRLRDRVEDNLIDAERNKVRADRKAAKEKLNLLNLIIDHAQDKR